MTTKRETLVKSFWLEDMTFEAFVFLVEKEVTEKIDQKLRPVIRNFYDQGLSTYNDIIKRTVWNYYGRIS